MDPAGEHRIFHLLQLAAHRVKLEGDRASLDAAGISAAQAAVLFVVQRSPGTSQREVAQALRLRESAITGMTARLIEAGFLVRTASPHDARTRCLDLTDAGVAALSAFRPSLDDLNRRITAAVGGREAVEALARALSAMSKL